jgi:ABC-type transport system substrate-binding protein
MPRGLSRGNKSVGGSKGVCPLGRRAGVFAPPEKGRQGAPIELKRPSEGGKRSCSPSELTLTVKLTHPAEGIKCPHNPEEAYNKKIYRIRIDSIFLTLLGLYYDDEIRFKTLPDRPLMNVRRVLILAPVAVMILLLQSYFWVPTYEEQTRGNPYRLMEYITGSIGDASILNPILAADSASSDINALVFCGLLDRDEELRFRGRVATHWEISEEAFFFYHERANVPGFPGAGPAALAAWLEHRLASWGTVKSVAVIQDIDTKVQVPAGGGKEVVSVPLEVQVKPPPRIRITLNEVDHDLFRKLEPILGKGYFAAFRPEDYCIFPPGLAPEGKQRLSRELLPATQHHPIILFHLRDGVRFHDGHPVTAEDVLFTYQAIMDPRNLSPRVPDFESVLRVEVVDPLTVRVVYRRLYSPALGTWGMGILPAHLLNKEALEREAVAMGKDPDNFTLRQSTFNRSPVGCGPFCFVEWKSDQYITLKRFEDYWEGPANYGQYTYRIIPEVLNQEMEFYAGSLDAYNVQPHQVARLRHDPRFQAFSGLSFGYTYIGYNLRRELFQDVRVRCALGMAIDVDKIIKFVLYGQGERITGPFPKQTDYYDHNIESLPYDPEGALKLLREAGWRKDQSGRLMKDGVPMRFTLITNSGNDLRRAILAIAQDAWKQLGIDVQTDVLEWAVFINERIDKQDFDAVVLGWSMGIDPDLYQIWHSSQTGHYQLNFVGYQNPEADDLIIRIRQEYNHDKQVALCHLLHRIIASDQPYTFLYVSKWTAVLDRRIVIKEVDAEGRVTYKPITPTKTGDYTFYFNRWVKLPEAPTFSTGE